MERFPKLYIAYENKVLMSDEKDLDSVFQCGINAVYYAWNNKKGIEHRLVKRVIDAHIGIYSVRKKEVVLKEFLDIDLLSEGFQNGVRMDRGCIYGVYLLQRT